MKVYKWTAAINLLVALIWLVLAVNRHSLLNLMDAVLWGILAALNSIIAVGRKRVLKLEEELAVERTRNSR